MKRLIIISGDLAAGKSTLANNLSNSLNIPCFIKDNVKELACDIIGFQNRDENKLISKASVAMMIYSFSQLAKTGYDAILEANFRENELKDILDIANNYSYKTAKIMLYGDLEILYHRFLERLPYRNPAHKSLHLDNSFSDYEKVNLDFRNYCTKDFIKIDSTKLNELEILNESIKIVEDI